MIGLVSGVVKGREDILTLKKGVILQNLVERGSGAQQLYAVFRGGARAGACTIQVKVSMDTSEIQNPQP